MAIASANGMLPQSVFAQHQHSTAPCEISSCGTVIGQLAPQFKIEPTQARDLWHLTNRINRKVLAHMPAPK